MSLSTIPYHGRVVEPGALLRELAKAVVSHITKRLESSPIGTLTLGYAGDDPAWTQISLDVRRDAIESIRRAALHRFAQPLGDALADEVIRRGFRRCAEQEISIAFEKAGIDAARATDPASGVSVRCVHESDSPTIAFTMMVAE